jgi:hypothetical protein
MKSIKRYSIKTGLFLLSTSFFLSSCEDVIEVELQNSEPQTVIESLITDDENPVELRISKSGDFYEPGSYPPVTKALVTISDHSVTDTLDEKYDGIYSGKFLKGIPGTTYTLHVEAEGKTYQATTSMPEKTELDSLGYEWGETPHYKGYMVNIYFNDQPVIKNYYRVKIFQNGKPFKDKESGNEIILMDDKIFDGKHTRMPAKRGGIFFNLGDTITIQLQSIGKETYDYFNTLKNAIAKSTSMMSMGKSMMMDGSAAPANPISNISNDALGYFGAASISSKTIVIGKK